jgi:hypothetical protein
MSDTKISDNEDLSEFADYLAEFDSIFVFDNEICPVCGVKVSDSLSLDKSPFVKYKSVWEEDKIKDVINELDLRCIPYKIEKRLDTEKNDSIVYLYDIFIPMNCISYLNKII